MQFNEYQSSLEELNIESYPQEVQEQFFDFINNVPYIRSLIAEDRPKAKDLPKDNEGKIIIDITKPHILEDMDYFRPTAIHFQQYGCVTKLRPNPNPNSEFGKWIREEIRRCHEGYIRESDGEWITGDMYFFLNYCPIQLTKKDKKGKTIRVIDFPRVWEGHYYVFHYLYKARNEGKHAAELASRGKGKSYLGASLLAKRFILGESEAVNKKVQCVVTASERKYIQGANQILDMFVYYINFCGQHTEWPSKKLTESLQNLQWTMGYQDLDTGTRRGTENAVTGITSKDDESKLRGTRGVLYLIEEMGTFPRLLNLYSVLRPSVEDGNDVWGTIFVYGTAGDSDSDFAGAQELMYNPQGYNMLAIPNVYDKEGQGRKYFTLFFGGYLNRAECYNDNGVSNVTKALLEILADRYKVKYNSTDINAITKRIAEIPITPQEAILRTKGNIFPVTALNERLNQLDNNPNEYSDVYVGTLEFVNNKVEFRPTNDIPIREFPTKDNKVEGAIEIFEMPQEIHGKIPQERYIMSLDNYENDTSNTMSLGSMFVLDLWTDRIVAEYTGRPMFADDLNEIARKMALFYNARIMYEAHPYSQEVNTPNGKMLWKDVNIGTKLFAPNGKIVEVIDIPINEYMPIYKVTLQDGRIVYASDNHIWNVEKLGYNKSTVNLTTKQMMDLGTRNAHKQHRFYILNNNKVEYKHKNVLIDPYTLGLLLAEGCFTKKHCRKNSIQVSSNEEDMMFYSSIIPYNIYDKHYGYNWRFIIENCKDIMTDLGLYNITSHNKFIPKEYLYNSYNVRLELLKGLMDGDGCASTKGARVLITVSKQLAEDVCSLCRSLGMNCKYTYNTVIQAGKVFNHYRVSIYTEETIFKLPRKVNQEHKYNSKIKGSKANAFLNKIAIETIEFSHYEMGKCVTVNSKNGLYLIGDYVVTHNCNKKNTFAYFSKMNCVYLLADAPEYLRQKQLIKTIGYGNTSKGINASAPIKNYGFTLIRDWLLKPVTTIVKQDGEEIESTVPNLHFLRNRALIKELILFNPDINVDRIMSLVQLMLYREEKMILYNGDMSKNKDRTPSDYKGNDDYFTRNYDNKLKNKSVNLGNIGKYLNY